MRGCLATVFVLAASTSVAGATPSVTVSPVAGAGALVLDGQGSATTRIVKLADVSLSTTSLGGFTVSISSGTLSKPDGRTPIPFQVVLVNNGAAAPLASAFTTPSGSTYTFCASLTCTGVGWLLAASEKDLFIKYTPAALQDPGTYGASVDINIVDN